MGARSLSKVMDILGVRIAQSWETWTWNWSGRLGGLAEPFPTGPCTPLLLSACSELGADNACLGHLRTFSEMLHRLPQAGEVARPCTVDAGCFWIAFSSLEALDAEWVTPADTVQVPRSCSTHGTGNSLSPHTCPRMWALGSPLSQGKALSGHNEQVAGIVSGQGLICGDLCSCHRYQLLPSQ